MELPKKLQCVNGCENEQYVYSEINGSPAGKCPRCEEVLTTDEKELLKALDERFIAGDEVFDREHFESA